MKYINIGSNPTTLDSDMVTSTRTMTKEEWLKAKAKHAAKGAKKATEDWKKVIKHKQKLHSTKDGKTPHKPLVTKSVRKNASGETPKPRKSESEDFRKALIW